MKTILHSATLCFRPLCNRFAALLVGIAAVQTVSAQTTGFIQTGAGPYDYNNTANWAGGTINGLWSSSLAVTAGQVVEFTGNSTLTTGLTFLESGGQNKTLRATGGASTMKLGGDILLNAAGNVAYSIGSTSGSQNLNVDLGGAVRTVTVFGGGNGGNFGKTLTFTNNVSNGGIIASGGGSGGGKIQFNALSISLGSAEVRDAELSFNGSNNTSANSVYTISGALTAGGGASTVTALAKTSATARNALVQAGSFARNSGSTVLFRGTSLGTTTIASATGGVANIAFTTGPTLSGGNGTAGNSTISIIAGAFGDTSATGTGFGATGGLVTYDSANGVRLLASSEYKASITDGQTALDNVKITNSSGVISTTTLTTNTTINSLSMGVSGTSGNQGITIAGATTLKLNSGVIYAEQNVTTAGSPAATDAMTLSVSTLDLNGQEGIILANTKLNTGGTVNSNAPLIINSTITNGTGLTIGDGLATNAGGYVVLGGASANTYSGNTTVNGAIVQLNKSTTNTFGNVVLNLGSIYDTGNQISDSSNLTINGGNFYLNGSNNSGSATNETVNNFTIGNGGINSGSGNSNTFNVNGNASISGGTVSMAQNAKLNVAGTTALSGGLLSVGTNNSSSVYNSKTTLTGAVTITNTASGTSAYTPITIGAGSAIGNLGGQVELSGNLTFVGNTNTNTVTIAAPTGTGLQGVLALNGVRTFDIGNGSASVDLTVNAPLINGTATGGLTKTGLGTLALSGASSFSGDTTVSTGTLLVSNASGSGLGSSNVSVNGGVLGGGGAFTGSVTVNSGGTLAPGASIESLASGALTLNTGSTFGYEVDFGVLPAVGADLQVVSGNLSLSGTANLTITNLTAGTFANATKFTLINYNGSWNNGLFTFLGNSLADDSTFTFNGQSWQIDYNASSGGSNFSSEYLSSSSYVNITAVPEPATWALLAFSLTTVIVLRRRRI